MYRKIFNTTLLATVLFILFAGEVSATGKLNFVFFIVDDLGWKDLSCMGSEFYETPAIDNLASDGVLCA